MSFTQTFDERRVDGRTVRRVREVIAERDPLVGTQHRVANRNEHQASGASGPAKRIFIKGNRNKDTAGADSSGFALCCAGHEQVLKRRVGNDRSDAISYRPTEINETPKQ